MADLIKLQDVAKEIGVSYPTVYRYCRNMKDDKLKGYVVVKRQGSKNMYYAKPSIVKKLKKIMGYEVENDEKE